VVSQIPFRKADVLKAELKRGIPVKSNPPSRISALCHGERNARICHAHDLSFRDSLNQSRVLSISVAFHFENADILQKKGVFKENSIFVGRFPNKQTRDTL
jgi:hypothetical protein